MKDDCQGRVAIVFPGNLETRRTATAANSRFADLFTALAERGARAEPVIWHDDFRDQVRQRLMEVDAALVWANPVEGGRDRSVLDAVLRVVAEHGVHVSAHPDIILAMGTKEVLYRTRSLGWGCDTHLYRSLEEMRDALPARLADGEARVLKQYRGNGGSGVWKVQLEAGVGGVPGLSSVVLARHASRGSIEQRMTLEAFLAGCEPYFAGPGRMIDQAYQARLPEGMIRCYLVHDRVAGFGHQAVNALYPAPPGAAAADAPQPGPRLYHPPTEPAFQVLKHVLETEWVPAMQTLLGIPTEQLPVLWDADFLLGPKDGSGQDSYVLCEINVSSVAPYPRWSVPHVVDATVARIAARRRGER